MKVSGRVKYMLTRTCFVLTNIHYSSPIEYLNRFADAILAFRFTASQLEFVVLNNSFMLAYHS